MKQTIRILILLLLLCPFALAQEENSAQSSGVVLAEYDGVALEKEVQKYPLEMKGAKVIRITLDSKENLSYFLIRDEQGELLVQLETTEWMGKVPAGNYTVEVLLSKQAAHLKNGSEFHLKLEEFMDTSMEELNTKPDSDLINTRWKLIQLNGNEIYTPEGGSDIFLTLSLDESKVNGFAGCNNFFGTYEMSENTLRFQRLGSTKRACPELDTESEFLAVLEAIEEYKIDGERLTVFSAGEPIAIFTALYLQ